MIWLNHQKKNVLREMLEIIRGKIWDSTCQTIVCPTSTQGRGGSKLADEFYKKYYESFKLYISMCEARRRSPGELWLMKDTVPWVLCLPTQIAFWQEERLPYIEHGLQSFVKEYKEMGITSIAFPLLGYPCKAIKEDDSMALMKEYLKPLSIHCEVYVTHKKRAWDD